LGGGVEIVRILAINVGEEEAIGALYMFIGLDIGDNWIARSSISLALPPSLGLHLVGNGLLEAM
jgi:hypothetical protein